MKTLTLILLAALSALAQSVPPGGGKVAAIVGPRGDTLPTTCSVGQLFQRTGATNPGLYGCGATDTWTQLGGVAATRTQSITVFAPSNDDSGKVQFLFPYAVTITKVWCSVNAATSITIDLDERAMATPDTAGTSVLTSPLVCDTDSANTTSFSNAGIAADVPVALLLSSLSGTPSALRVFVTYTID